MSDKDIANHKEETLASLKNDPGLWPLLGANAAPFVLLMVGMIPGDWGVEIKFAITSLCVVSMTVGLYYLGTNGTDNRLIAALGLSAIAFSLLATLGTFVLH